MTSKCENLLTCNRFAFVHWTHSHWVHTTFRLDLFNFETVFSHPFNKTLCKWHFDVVFCGLVCNRTFIHIANYQFNFDQWHKRLNAYREKKYAEFIQLDACQCRCRCRYRCQCNVISFVITFSQLQVWLTYIYTITFLSFHGMEITSTLFDFAVHSTVSHFTFTRRCSCVRAYECVCIKFVVLM